MEDKSQGNPISHIRGADVDPATAWIEELITDHTPTWALWCGLMATFNGFRWMNWYVLPHIRRFTDLEIKTETNIKGGKGFRPGSELHTRTLRVYKKGRMIGERTFEPILIKNSAYSKLK